MNTLGSADVPVGINMNKAEEKGKSADEDVGAPRSIT